MTRKTSYKKKYTREEIKKRQRLQMKKANLKYQKTSEKYKEYKRFLWKKKLYTKIMKYLIHAGVDTRNFINLDDDTPTEMRNKFKERFGINTYKMYIR